MKFKLVKKIVEQIDEDHIIWFLMMVSACLLVAIIFTEKTKSTFNLAKRYLRNISHHSSTQSTGFESLNEDLGNESSPLERKVTSPFEEIAIAKIKNVLGEIRLKKAFSPTWSQIYTGTDLYEGDQVYGGEISSAEIIYYREGTHLDLSGYSLLRISQDPPEKSEFPRQNNKGKVYVPPPGEPQFANLMKDKLLEAPKLPKEEIEKLRSQSRAKDKIVILGPVGNIMLIAKKFPTPMAIRLEYRWDKTRLWAYLWDRSDSTTPIWSGASKGSFSNIIIPRPGVYSLLIQSEDGAAESPSIEIAATKRDGNTVSQLGFDFSPNKDLAVVYQ
jgi:hypothetical protein